MALVREKTTGHFFDTAKSRSHTPTYDLTAIVHQKSGSNKWVQIDIEYAPARFAWFAACDAITPPWE
jgi:hypothetical protein